MNTLIVPCCGRSRRFPEMKPKWLLTHPDGQLMIQKALTGLNTEIFSRIIITIAREHAELFDAELILQQAFSGCLKVEVFVLDDFTRDASTTIYCTLVGKNVTGPFTVKDSDNCVHVTLPTDGRNLVTGYDLHQHPDISNIPGKSFIVTGEQGILQDIVEKKVVSNIVCLGVYSFNSVDLFTAAYLSLAEQHVSGEIFVSHIISYILAHGAGLFEVNMARNYEDWGTIVEWRAIQEKCQTYFVDLDGVLLKNSGLHGKVNWSNNQEILQDNVDRLRYLQKDGAQLVITTSRPERFRAGLAQLCADLGLQVHAFVMGLNHAPRTIVNDFAPTNPYPSCRSVSVPRDGSIAGYL